MDKVFKEVCTALYIMIIIKQSIWHGPFPRCHIPWKGCSAQSKRLNILIGNFV